MIQRFVSLFRWSLLILGIAILTYRHRMVFAFCQWTIYILFLPVSFTLTFRFDLLHMLLAVFTLSAIGLIIWNYRSSKSYNKLKNSPSRVAPLQLHPTSTEEEDPLTSTLGTIRIFGYLEADVYAELSRNLEEKSLGQGEMLKAKGRDFYVVLEGSVQLRIPKSKPVSLFAEALRSLEEDEGSMAEQSIISEVGVGGIVSSLFDVLSLFTDTDLSGSPSLISVISTTETRLMCIPEDTFRNIRQKFPKASAHIVQVIMSRFQRVTFMTLHQYLGLTKEAILIEQSLNDQLRQSIAGAGNETGEGGPGGIDSIIQTIVGERGRKERFAEMMTRLGRDERESLQKQVFAHLYSLFDLERPADQEATLWELVSLRVLQPDQHLYKQGDRNPGLFILLEGALDLTSQSQNPQDKDRLLITVERPGSVLGAMAAFMGHYSMVTVRARRETLVAYINRRHLEWIVERHPRILIVLAGRFLERLPPLVKSIDMALEWMHRSAGQVLCNQGDQADHIYLVLHGRLRALRETGGTREIEVLAEYGAGQSIGEMEMILGNSWPGTIHAIRDTEVACIPRILFDALASIHPEISLNVSRILARKSQMLSDTFMKPKQSTLRNIAIIPADQSMHSLAEEFSQRLRDELSSMGAVLLLDSAMVIEVLGKHAFSAIGKLKLSEWLNQIEGEYKIVLYLADAVWPSRWTRRSIRQADCIFLVAHADASPDLGSMEHLLFGGNSSVARKELVLIHPTMQCPTGLTHAWLERRPWISAHHHVGPLSFNTIQSSSQCV